MFSNQEFSLATISLIGFRGFAGGTPATSSGENSVNLWDAGRIFQRFTELRMGLLVVGDESLALWIHDCPAISGWA